MGGGAMLVMAGLMTYMFATKDDDDSTNEKTGATALQPVINISTQTPDSLIFQMSAATVDICYKREPTVGLERDLLEPVFFNDTKALGFNRMLKLADGAIANVSHIALTPAIGKGYNGKSSDFRTQAEFEAAMGGVLYQTWTTDWFQRTSEYIRVLGLPDDVVLNPNDTWAQNKYRIENSQGEYIFFGSEEVSAEIPRSWTPAQYLAWAKTTRDSVKKYYPNKKLIADQGQIYTGTPKNLKWRKEITPTTLTGMYGADCYLQLNDVMKFTLNMDSNAMKVSYYFDTLIPVYIDSFKRSFPGWKWVVGENHIVDAREGSEPYFIINKNMVGCVAWARFYQTFLTNQDLFSSAVQMELKKYIDPNEVNSKVIKMLNSLLKPGWRVTDVTFENMSGCVGVSIRNVATPKKHAILISNSSASTYIVPKVKIDGQGKSPAFTVQRMYTSDATWSNTIVLRDSITAETITILPKSVNIISFTTGSTPTVESKIKL